MYKFLMKNGQTIALAIGVLIVAIFLYSGITGASGSDLSALTAEEKMNVSYFDFGIGSAVWMSIIAFALAFVVFGLLNIARNPKSAIGLVGGLIAIAVIYFVTSGMGGDPSQSLTAVMEKFNITPGTSKFITGSIWTAIVLAAVSFIALILGELKGLFS